jgi:hypothetical protein
MEKRTMLPELGAGVANATVAEKIARMAENFILI